MTAMYLNVGEKDVMLSRLTPVNLSGPLAGASLA